MRSAPAGNGGAAEAAGGLRWAAGLMFAGAALFAGEIAAQIALMNTVRYSGNGGNFFPEAGLIFVGIPVTAVECALWVWTGSIALAGRGWARIVASALLRRHVPAAHRLHPRFSVTCGCHQHRAFHRHSAPRQRPAPYQRGPGVAGWPCRDHPDLAARLWPVLRRVRAGPGSFQGTPAISSRGNALTTWRDESGTHRPCESRTRRSVPGARCTDAAVGRDRVGVRRVASGLCRRAAGPGKRPDRRCRRRTLSPVR